MHCLLLPCLLQSKYNSWAEKLNSKFHDTNPQKYPHRDPDKVGEKWRNLENKCRAEALKVSDGKKQLTQTGSSVTEEESVAYQSQWHLWDTFRNINKGSKADQLEQQSMGTVTESAAPGVQSARPNTTNVQNSSPTDLTGNICC